MAFNEFLESDHKLTETVLVYLCVNSLIFVLRAIVTDAEPLQKPNRAFARNRRFTTGRDFIYRAGIHPDCIPFYILNLALFVWTSVVLIRGEFLLLGVPSLGFGVIGCAILIVVYAIAQLNLPIFEVKVQRSDGNAVKSKILVIAVSTLLLFLQIKALIASHGFITKEEWRFGVLLSALSVVAEYCARHTRFAPDLSILKSIRGRLAFSWLDLAEAKAEAESVLLGLEGDRRIVKQVQELTESIYDNASRVQEVVEMMKFVIAICDEAENASNKLAVYEKSRERIIAYQKHIGRLFGRIVDAPKERNNLEVRLRTAIRIARTTGHVKPSEEDRIIERVGKAMEAEHKAASQLGDLKDQWKLCGDKIMDVFGGKIESKLYPLRWRDILAFMLER